MENVGWLLKGDNEVFDIRTGDTFKIKEKCDCFERAWTGLVC